MTYAPWHIEPGRFASETAAQQRIAAMQVFGHRGRVVKLNDSKRPYAVEASYKS